MRGAASAAPPETEETLAADRKLRMAVSSSLSTFSCKYILITGRRIRVSVCVCVCVCVLPDTRADLMLRVSSVLRVSPFSFRVGT